MQVTRTRRQGSEWMDVSNAEEVALMRYRDDAEARQAELQVVSSALGAVSEIPIPTEKTQPSDSFVHANT